MVGSHHQLSGHGFLKSSMVFVHFLLVFYANSALFLSRGWQDQNAVRSVCMCAVGLPHWLVSGNWISKGWSCEAGMPGDHPQKTGMPWSFESANSAGHHEWSVSSAPCCVHCLICNGSLSLTPSYAKDPIYSQTISAYEETATTVPILKMRWIRHREVK